MNFIFSIEQVNDQDSRTAEENRREKPEAEMDGTTTTTDDVVPLAPRTSTPDVQASAADRVPRSPGACSRTSDDVSSIGSDDERKMTNTACDNHGDRDEAAALDTALSTLLKNLSSSVMFSSFKMQSVF